MNSPVELKEIKVNRSGRNILDINKLNIFDGQFTGIIGTNGAGKTTLLKVCLGLENISTGNVKLFGRELSSLSLWKKTNLRKKVGYIPQVTEYNSELPLTLEEVVGMGRTSVKPLFKKFNSEDRKLIDKWIDALDLSKNRKQIFRTLSGGERQKTLIARAMCQQPEIIIFDEPCANLDFNAKFKTTEIIEDLYRKNDLTILFVSHETNLLPPACNRLILMNEGKIIADGSPDKILLSAKMREAYNSEVECKNIYGRYYTLRDNTVNTK